MCDESIDLDELRRDLGLKDEKVVTLVTSAVIPAGQVGSWINSMVTQYSENHSAWLDD